MPCVTCRGETPPGARFCPACGSPCGPGPVTARPTGRKVVTLLFCDLVGSTALSGALDAETLRSVTLRWFDLMCHQIEEQGGTVEKFIGDAVMAVFGVPTVREDDARRALAAALAMRDALDGFNDRLAEAVGVRLRMRIGINTGQAVTGSATLRQAMVSGEVVNVAARLEQHAAEGEILVGPGTLAAAGPGVRTARTGPLLLKGKTDRVTAHRLLALDDEDDPRTLRRFDLAFVGRHRELALSDVALSRVRVTGRAGRLVVAGEAGQGKTRLVREWLRRSAQAPGGPRHGVGRCRARGEQPSLGPLADAVADLLAGCGTAETFPSPELDLLRRGLLLDGTPNPSPADTCAALAKVLADLAAARPVVLVVDDAHWAAAPLFDALDRLLRALSDAAVLIVLLTRPQLFDSRPELASDAVVLGGLSDAEARSLAAELTGAGTDSAPLGPQVLARVGGNPLHLEQLLLADDPFGGDTVPLSLQALIGARVDALAPTERQALGLASVLGGDFTTGELAALAVPPEPEWTSAELKTALRRLVRHRLIAPDGTAFRFAGGLIQEVVYAGQSKQDRADRHERAARLETVRARGAAAVGAHLDHAYRHRIELGAQDAHTDTLRRRAADTLAEAGRLALAHADPVWAAGLLTRATARYAPGEPGATTARRRLGQTLLDLGRAAEGTALLREVLAPQETTAPDRAEGVLEAAHARLALASAGPGAAAAESPAQAAEATLPVFAAAHDDLGQARACLRLAQRAQEQGRHGRAEVLLGRALDHAVRADAEPERAAVLGATGVSLWRGPQPAADAVARCRALLADQGPGRRAVRLTLNCPLAVLLALRDDPDGARACLTEAAHLARRLGYAEADAFLPLFTATVADLAGHPAEALAALEQAATVARRLGATGLLRGALLDAARIHLDLGDPDAARAVLARVEGESAQPDTERDQQKEPLGAERRQTSANKESLDVNSTASRRGPSAPSREAQAARAGERRRTAGTDPAVERRSAPSREGRTATAGERRPAAGTDPAAQDRRAPSPEEHTATAGERTADPAAAPHAAGAQDRLRTAGTDPAAAPRARGARDGCRPHEEAAPHGEDHTEPARPSTEAADLGGLRARLAAADGRAATAVRLAARAVAAAERTDSPIVRGLAALDLARTLGALGRSQEAARAAARARGHFAAKGHLPAVRQAEALLGALDGRTAAPVRGTAR